MDSAFNMDLIEMILLLTLLSIIFNPRFAIFLNSEIMKEAASMTATMRTQYNRSNWRLSSYLEIAHSNHSESSGNMTYRTGAGSLGGRTVPQNEIVYIIDDDASVREALSSLLRANGKQVELFISGQDFLDFTRHDSCACVILDLRMPGMNGLQVQELIAMQTTIPVIFITGRGDVPSTVTAMKGGAIDFLTKPIDETALLASVERALKEDRRLRSDAAERERLLALYNLLTPREQQVLSLLVRGLLNKQAAVELGITEYTVQVHRGHIMRKMAADSFATLVKLASKLNLEHSEAC